MKRYSVWALPLLEQIPAQFLLLPFADLIALTPRTQSISIRSTR